MVGEYLMFFQNNTRSKFTVAKIKLSSFNISESPLNSNWLHFPLPLRAHPHPEKICKEKTEILLDNIVR